MADTDPRLDRDRDLLARLKTALPTLREATATGRHFDDGIYRFYHQSHKVFGLQTVTKKITEALQSVDPDRPLNDWYLQIVADGLGKRFSWTETNQNWLAETRPIVEAYFHAMHMLQCVIECAETMETVSPMLEWNWATVLYLYQQR